MLKKSYLATILLSLVFLAPEVSLAFQEGGSGGESGNSPSPKLLSKLFGGKKFTPEESQKYRYFTLDMDGDKRKELLLYVKWGEKPFFVPPKKKKCLCDPPPPSPVEERYLNSLRRLKKYIWKFSLVPLKGLKLKKKNRRRIKHNLEIWFDSERLKSKDDLLKYQYAICRKFSRYRTLRRFYLQKVYFFTTKDSEGVELSWYRCTRFGRTSFRRAKRLHKRWAKSVPRPSLPMCDCPEKKKKVEKKADSRPPFTVWLAAEVFDPKSKKAGASEDLGTVELGGGGGEELLLQKKWKLLKRWNCDSFEIVQLTLPPHNFALKIEEERKNPVDKSTERFVQFFMYFQGTENPVRSVFKLQVLKEGDPENPEVRLWKEVQLKNLDPDAWLEIAVDHYFEDAQFSGPIGRTIYKWNGFKFVELNVYRRIFRAVATSTLVRKPLRRAPLSKKVIYARSAPSNAIDGFFDTSWFPKSPGLNKSLRIEWGRPVKLSGIAVVVKTPPSNFTPFVSQLWRGVMPTPSIPKFVQIKTAAPKFFYLKIPSDREPAIGILQFPQPVVTQFVQLTLSTRYVDPQTGREETLRPEQFKGKALFISEVIPILDQFLYTASSVLKKPGELYSPQNAGDFSSKTAWAEAKKGDGIGEWLQLILPKPQLVSELQIVNGCRRLGEKYTINNRIREAVLHFSDGSSQTVKLKDTHKPQSVKINPVRTRTIRLEIKSVYPGKLEKITCLSEFRVK